MQKDKHYGTYTLALKSKEMTERVVNHICSKYGIISKLRPTSQNRYYISFTEKSAAKNALKILQNGRKKTSSLARVSFCKK